MATLVRYTGLSERTVRTCLDLWVPKICATWADALRSAGRFRPMSSGRLEGRGLGRGGMISALWA